MKTIDINDLSTVTGGIFGPSTRYVQLSTRNGSGWAVNVNKQGQALITKPGGQTHELTLVPSGTTRF